MASPQTILITGANRGIGLALAREFLARGHTIIATARIPGASADLQQLARSANGRCIVESLDVTADKSVADLAARLAPRRSIDLLINNAAILIDFEATLSKISSVDFARMYDTNTLGAVRVTRALVPLLQKSQRPAIVNMSTGSASITLNTTGKGYGYRMTKVALNMFTKSLSVEFPGIISVCIDPGWVKTDMGGPGAFTPVVEASQRLCNLIEKLTPNHSGKFLHHSGQEIPW